MKTVILQSITKDIEDLIRNELLRNKYTLSDKSIDDIYKNEINMLREELKSKDFIIKDLLQTIKEIKTKFVLFQSNTACMSSSEANLVPANNSAAIGDVCNNNDEVADINDEILFSDRKDINKSNLKNLDKTNLKR